jgi:uncharacterized protein (TIGR02391 family)
MGKDLLALVDELESFLAAPRIADFRSILLAKLSAIRLHLRSEDFGDILPDLDQARHDLGLYHVDNAVEVLRGYVLPQIRLRVGQLTAKAEGEQLWGHLHPRIRAVSGERYTAGQYSDAVEAAIKEVNYIVKIHYKQVASEELDGVALMNKAFSARNPAIPLGDLDTESGRNVQQGYMQIFAGAMAAIRNPAAHANLSVERVLAIHYLYFASLLLYVFDARPEPPNRVPIV